MNKNFTEVFVTWLPYAMMVVFCLGVVLRGLVFYTVKRHEWFAREFEKRVNKFIESETPGKVGKASFYVLAKKMLERTYYEVFEVRERLNRRRSDRMMSTGDRVFLIKQGSAWFVRDVLKQLKFIKWKDGHPNLLNVTKSTFDHNPCFNRVFGIIPIAGMNDLLSILPGLFVVAGILGTFMGIAGGLGELGAMDLKNLEATHGVMDRFLGEIAFAMKASIIGIAFSLVLNIFNTLCSPDRVFSSTIDRLQTSLDLLWYRSDNNDFSMTEKPFDEHRDPADALAEEALQREVNKTTRTRDLDTLMKPKAS